MLFMLLLGLVAAASGSAHRFSREPVNHDIPHVIHQSWKDVHVPPEYARWTLSWKTLHPSWEYRCDARGFIALLEERCFYWFCKPCTLAGVIQLQHLAGCGPMRKTRLLSANTTRGVLPARHFCRNVRDTQS